LATEWQTANESLEGEGKFLAKKAPKPGLPEKPCARGPPRTELVKNETTRSQETTSRARITSTAVPPKRKRTTRRDFFGQAKGEGMTAGRNRKRAPRKKAKDFAD